MKSYFDVCLVVRRAVCVCVGFLERMCKRSRFCHLRCKGWSLSLFCSAVVLVVLSVLVIILIDLFCMRCSFWEFCAVVKLLIAVAF